MTYDKNLGLLVDIQQALSGSERLTRDQLKRVGPFASRDWMVPLKDRYFAELLLLLGDDLVSVQAALDKNQAVVKEFDASTRRSMQEVCGTIQQFDRASRKLTAWLLGLTVALVALTLAIAFFTVLLWVRHS